MSFHFAVCHHNYNETSNLFQWPVKHWDHYFVLPTQFCQKNVFVFLMSDKIRTLSLVLQYILCSFGEGELDFHHGGLFLNVFHSVVRTLGGANLDWLFIFQIKVCDFCFISFTLCSSCFFWSPFVVYSEVVGL